MRQDGPVADRPTERARARQKKAAVLVLGMHRSGTSALTRVLSLLGCTLPKTLMGGDSSNQAGHWESTVLCRLNDRILTSGGSHWNDWLAFNPGWMSSPSADEYRDEALAALAGEFGAARLFVMKDPRICRLAPFWLDALDAFDAAPAIVLPLRNPLEVAASLHRRDGLDPSFGHLLWLRHVLDAERATRGRRRFFASYDSLLTGWRAMIERMQPAFGFTLPRLPESAATEIEAFLTEELRHERVDPVQVTDNPGLSVWLRDSFTILDRWAREGESARDHAALDRIRSAFDAAAPAFARPVALAAQAAAALKRTTQELADARSKLGEGEARVAALAAASKELADLRGKLAQSESALAQRRHESEENAAELAAARQEVQALKAARAEYDALLASYKEQVALLTAHERERQAAFDALRNEAAGTRAALEAAQQAAAAAEREKRQSAAEAQKAKAEKQVTEGRLKERFDEIAVLTRMVHSRGTAAERLRGSVVAMVAFNGTPPLVPAALWRMVALRRKVALLKRSGLLDADWYLKTNADVAEAGIDPFEHYVEYGATEGRAPNEAFGRLWDGRK